MNSNDHVKHSATSAASAANTRQSRAMKTQMILHALEFMKDGATSFELEELFSWPHQTVSSVLSLAEAAGLICRNGVKRRGPAGRQYSYAYFALKFVPAEDRLDVVRQNEVVVRWVKDEEKPAA